jgi:2-C-methyl-D-erythritol 4-phosphate cytidylyltransferase
MSGSTANVSPANRFYALVPAAGQGLRAGAGLPKQYAPVGGTIVLDRTLRALACVQRLDGVLVVLSPDDAAFEQALPGWAGTKRWAVREGGSSRAATVSQGLSALLRLGASPDDWVLVHDAARCLLRPQWVDQLIDACHDDPVGGLLALPLADTLKQATPEGRVAATVDRAGKWAAQTPQMFRIGLLREALLLAGDRVTDEASAIEAMGLSPRLVRGDARNLKVTWPEDFALAELLLADAPFVSGAAVAADPGDSR